MIAAGRIVLRKNPWEFNRVKTSGEIRATGGEKSPHFAPKRRAKNRHPPLATNFFPLLETLFSGLVARLAWPLLSARPSTQVGEGTIQIGEQLGRRESSADGPGGTIRQ
jgi:hypothetical protein